MLCTRSVLLFVVLIQRLARLYESGAESIKYSFSLEG